jgi:hypothetical protein
MSLGPDVTKRNELMCTWSGLVFVLLFALGWVVIGGFVPPPSPAADAAQIVAFYQTHTPMVRLGLLLTQASCIFFLPWVAVISVQMKRLEAPGTVLATTQLISGAVALLIILLPTMIWGVASFRPERNPELMLLLNDLAWLIFTMTFAPFVMQAVAIGWAILGDPRAQPLFPRWVAYFNFWTALSFVPAGLIIFFKTGPFAWNGVIGFWLPVSVFFVWFIVMLVFMLKAIRREGD